MRPESGLSAYVLSEFAFGRWGGKVANLSVACSLLGWYGVTGTMFGRAGAQLGANVFGVDWPIELYVIVGSSLMVGVTLSGFKGIDKLALALVPVMVIFLAWQPAYRTRKWRIGPCPPAVKR